MLGSRISLNVNVTVACCAIILSMAISASATTETVLQAFPGGSNGAAPTAPLIFDKAGNLYGTASSGGAHRFGAVFELTPSSTGFSETVLYSFASQSDGGVPIAGLIMDAAGNLYGTTLLGGNFTACPSGCGVVFKLTHTSTGWQESVLHSFSAGKDGAVPDGGLIFDSARNLYGTTNGGGTQNVGVIYKLSHTATGWKEAILHTFTGGSDGSNPVDTLLLDASGNLYGSAQHGGLACSNNQSGCGVVFRLTRTSSGWKETVLHSFTGGSDGGGPGGEGSSLVFDTAGNLYGVTFFGGGSTTCNGGCGVVFKLTHTSTGWQESTLYSFTGGSDGASPQGSLLFDSGGNLYGTAEFGGGSSACTGSPSGCGTVFELISASTFNVLYSFSGGSDGAFPVAGLISDAAGNLYSTGVAGGTIDSTCPTGCGVVYELLAAAAPK